jgi:hypothetical protein
MSAALEVLVARRVRSPSSGLAHQLGRNRKLGLPLALCGAYFEAHRGWKRTSAPVDCRKCMAKIAQHAEQVSA